MEDTATLLLEESNCSNLGNITTAGAMDKDCSDALHNQRIDYKTPKKSSILIDGERLLDKINILTTKPDNTSTCAKVSLLAFLIKFNCLFLLFHCKKSCYFLSDVVFVYKCRNLITHV